MTYESPSGKGDDWKDCRPRHPDDECDPSSIDDLVCRAKGVAAQATYNATYQPAVEQAQKDYDTARKAYRERRHEAALAVQDMKHQIKHLVERIRCLIEQDRVVRCLDDAFDEVSEQLDCCEGCYGCCVEDYNYDSTPPTKYRDLVRRIEKYQREADKAKACFATLVGEPAALAKRVVDAKAAIDKVNADLAKDPATVDLKRVYAEARVADRMLSRIWHGFADSAAFVDCLCRALTSWSTGAEVISVLTGARAVEECKRDAAKTWCDALLANPVDEILAGYDRLCPSQKPCKPAPEEDDQNESDPCADEDEPHDKPRGHPGQQGV
ncbi:hypothetical protein EV649_5065 [Kribbella sp. VKM Ac-2569]|uniref:hypothetical protein n=1 Tax=Kribbella sp. VKM Ac-2569 TaxID=2512220 RepID=UPI00102AF2E0|nr:hypothetical protein [Kribbella sp. VKM Ac-2569]RZT17518.1 hypothetical protein EV649_5065 [Kribbella sp. VKM Ac-2569]